jgi:hypothetical protein
VTVVYTWVRRLDSQWILRVSTFLECYGRQQLCLGLDRVCGWNYLRTGLVFHGPRIIESAASRKSSFHFTCQRKVCFGDAVHGFYTQCTHGFHKHPNDKIDDPEAQPWIWFGTRFGEIGFLASLIQMFAASVFWIATITGIPGVINMNNVGLTNGIFWAPQIIGGTGFIIARYVYTVVRLTTVFSSCWKRKMDGTGSVRLDRWDGMSVSGISLDPSVSPFAVLLALPVRNRGLRFRAIVLRSGGVGLS